MQVSSYTFVRNICFTCGVLVALLCVFPPPEFMLVVENHSPPSQNINGISAEDKVYTSQIEAVEENIIRNESDAPVNVDTKENDATAANEAINEVNNRELQADYIDDQFAEDSVKAKIEEKVDLSNDAADTGKSDKEVSSDTVASTSVDEHTSSDVDNSDVTLQYPSGYLKIEMELGSGHTFQFNIDLSDTQLPTTAANFCFEHANELGVDENNIQHGCVDPVLNYLTEQVNGNQGNLSTARDQAVISVDLDIDGRAIHFEIDLRDSNSVNDQAITFCTQYGEQFGVTEETLSQCTDDVRKALARAVSSYLAQHDNVASEELSTNIESIKVEEQKEKGPQDMEPQHSSPVFVTAFPVASKNFEYRYVVGVEPSVNAANFCRMYWDELEGAFKEADMTGVDEKTCALIVEEITFPRVQGFMATLEGDSESK